MTLVGCGGSVERPEPAPLCQSEVDRPEWVSTPPSSDRLVEVASARSTVPSMAVQKALSRGRARLSDRLSVRVQVMTDNYFRELGIDGSSQRAEDFHRNVSRQVSNTVLSGSRVDGTPWRDPCTGETYVRVVVDHTAVVGEVRRSAVEEIKRVQAATNKAVEELHKQVDQTFGGPDEPSEPAGP